MVYLLFSAVALLGLMTVAARGALRAGGKSPGGTPGPPRPAALRAPGGKPARPSAGHRPTRPVTGRRPGRLAGLLPGPARSVRSRWLPEPLPPGATVSFEAERQHTEIDDVIGALDRELVGLAPVKQKVEQIASLLLVDRARERFGLTAPRPNLHMCFTGQPGTGKTTMALRMADLLHRLGYLETNQVVHAMRNDLVGEFVGHTAPKTKRVLDRAMGGVLFIDEAYYLYRSSDSKDYGQEVIDILLQVMEQERENLVVILAGYRDRMDEFFEMNPGMRSRIAHHIHFAPYSLDELVAIGQLMLEEASYQLSPAATAALREHLEQQIRLPGFANGRSVRNSLDRARLHHAYRLAGTPGERWTREDLMRLEPSDIIGLPSAASAGPTASAQQ